MFEDITYEKLLSRMLEAAGAAEGEDVRESSVIYNALAPAAAELQNMYIQLEEAVRESFADTAGRSFLVRRAAERGITPEEAVCAVVKGSFNIDVPEGTVFSCGDLNYTVIKSHGDKTALLECSEAGSAGNISSGQLIPVEYIDGLRTAQITSLVSPGRDEEDTQSLRKRYFESFTSSPFGGNVKDYKNKVSSIPGVGGVKVYPVYNGPGTVKLVVISSDMRTPSAGLVEKIQSEVDPVHGEGRGIAPIGHSVTVLGCGETKINISSSFTLSEGTSFDSVKNEISTAAAEYFAELAAEWDSSSGLIVRISRLESRFIEIDGVVDVSGTLLNGTADNIELGGDFIPVLGTVSENE